MHCCRLMQLLLQGNIQCKCVKQQIDSHIWSERFSRWCTFDVCSSRGPASSPGLKLDSFMFRLCDNDKHVQSCSAVQKYLVLPRNHLDHLHLFSPSSAFYFDIAAPQVQQPGCRHAPKERTHYTQYGRLVLVCFTVHLTHCIALKHVPHQVIPICPSVNHTIVPFKL